MAIGKPVLPKEHGAWVALLVPLFIGSFAIYPAEGFKPVAAMVFALSSVFGVFAMEPLRLLVKPVKGISRERVAGWLLVFATGSVSALLISAAVWDRWGLLWLFIPAAVLTGVRMWAGAARATRELSVELFGVLGLCVTAPAAYYIQHGEVTIKPIFIYLLCVIWFEDRLMTARRTLERLRTGASLPAVHDRFGWYSRELVIHAAALALAALVVVLAGGHAPIAAFLPFLLATAKNVFDLLSGSPLPGPMKIGFTEMGLGIVFGLAMTAAWLAG